MSPTKGEGDILVSASVRQILVLTISLEPDDGIPPNLPKHISGTSLRAG